jgi:capsule polysaccharide export protein KpsE/RkpR
MPSIRTGAFSQPQQRNLKSNLESNLKSNLEKAKTEMNQAKIEFDKASTIRQEQIERIEQAKENARNGKVSTNYNSIDADIEDKAPENNLKEAQNKYEEAKRQYEEANNALIVGGRLRSRTSSKKRSRKGKKSQKRKQNKGKISRRRR